MFLSSCFASETRPTTTIYNAHPATRWCPNDGLMFVQLLRSWSNIKPTSVHRLVFSGGDDGKRMLITLSLLILRNKIYAVYIFLATPIFPRHMRPCAIDLRSSRWRMGISNPPPPPPRGWALSHGIWLFTVVMSGGVTLPGSVYVTLTDSLCYKRPGSALSYKLRYIVGFWLVEMAISTNPKPTIYRNLYENTDPGSACRHTPKVTTTGL